MITVGDPSCVVGPGSDLDMAPFEEDARMMVEDLSDMGHLVDEGMSGSEVLELERPNEL